MRFQQLGKIEIIAFGATFEVIEFVDVKNGHTAT